MRVVTEAGDHSEPFHRRDRDSIRTRTDRDYRSPFERGAVYGGETRAPPIGDEHLSVSDDDPRRFGKIGKCLQVATLPVIDHIEGVRAGMRDKDALCLRVVRSVVEVASLAMGYRDEPTGCEHDALLYARVIFAVSPPQKR